MRILLITATEAEIAPLIEYIGEIGEDKKGEFLGNAKALLFPIDWPEPFGMVMIEAMANGTPVVAFNCGSVPEVIDEGETGYIVNSIEEACDVVSRLETFDRKHCREVFDKKYTSEIMAKNYVALYRQLIEDRRTIRLIKNNLDIPGVKNDSVLATAQ